MITTASLLTLALALPAVLGAGSHSVHRRHHAEVAKRSEENGLQKRFESARWSFYDVGLGACGQVNVATDFIVALNADQFGSGYPGPHCGQVITMNYNGKSTQATITDRCPGCPFGGLDLSRGLFNFFAPESVGILSGSWSFGGGGAPAPPPPPPKPQWTPPAVEVKTTWKPEPTTWKKLDPTTTWIPEAVKETPKVEIASSSAASTSVSASVSASVSTSVSVSVSISSSSAGAAATSAAAAAQPNNVEKLNNITASMGRCAAAGAKRRKGTSVAPAAASGTPSGAAPAASSSTTPPA